MNKMKALRDEIRDLHKSGMTYESIAYHLGVTLGVVNNVLKYTKKFDNGIANCPFCGSHKTYLSSTENRNPGRMSTMFHVNCNTCHAKGPKVSYYPDRDMDYDGVRAKAIRLWNMEDE